MALSYAELVKFSHVYSRNEDGLPQDKIQSGRTQSSTDVHVKLEGSNSVCAFLIPNVSCLSRFLTAFG